MTFKYPKAYQWNTLKKYRSAILQEIDQELCLKLRHATSSKQKEKLEKYIDRVANVFLWKFKMDMI